MGLPGTAGAAIPERDVSVAADLVELEGAHPPGQPRCQMKTKTFPWYGPELVIGAIPPLRWLC
jgi:hypothetical protein